MNLNPMSGLAVRVAAAAWHDSAKHRSPAMHGGRHYWHTPCLEDAIAQALSFVHDWAAHIVSTAAAFSCLSICGCVAQPETAIGPLLINRGSPHVTRDVGMPLMHSDLPQQGRPVKANSAQTCNAAGKCRCAVLCPGMHHRAHVPAQLEGCALPVALNSTHAWCAVLAMSCWHSSGQGVQAIWTICLTLWQPALLCSCVVCQIISV